MSQKYVPPWRILSKAKKLISDKKRWTKNTNARKADGSPTRSCGEEAVAWCAVGAVVKVEYDEKVKYPPTLHSPYNYLFGAARSMGFITVSGANDSPDSSHSNVMKMFTKAIKIAKQAEKEV